MIAIRQHSPQDYAALPNIDESNVGMLAEDDRDCLNELGDFIVKAEAHDRFGAVLLHSHFPVELKETFLEEVDTDAERVTLRPKRDVDHDVAATSICFADEPWRDGRLQMVGLEFASPPVLAGVSPIDQTDGPVLAHLAQVLARRGKSRRFGIKLLHDPLKLDGRVLLETCDPVKRVLTCEITTCDDPGFKDAIPTIFRWQPANELSEDGQIVSQSCVQFCKSVQGCVRLGDGSHQGSSSHEPIHGEGPQ